MHPRPVGDGGSAYGDRMAAYKGDRAEAVNWRAWLDRLCSAIAASGLLVVAACLFWPEPEVLASREWSSRTIYPWWTVVLGAVGLCTSIVALCSLRTSRTRWMPGVTGVVAAELAGLGIVAAKHWQPAFGMGGGYAGDAEELQRLAVLIGATGALVALVSLGQMLFLRTTRSRSGPTKRTFWLLGAGLIVLLPPAIGIGAPEDRDLTSLAAYTLIYSAPWGVAVIATAWLDRSAATAVLVSCAACASLALVGPQMTDLVLGEPRLGFLVAVATSVLALLIRWRLDRTDEPPTPLQVRTSRAGSA